MKKITVTGPYLGIPVGSRLILTDQQADARRHALAKIGEPDLYITTAPTGFKCGEVLSVEMEVGKDIAPLFSVQPDHEEQAEQHEQQPALDDLDDDLAGGEVVVEPVAEAEPAATGRGKRAK